jgi:cobalt-zinc-cadmium efflux system membrane fusion protein
MNNNKQQGVAIAIVIAIGLVLAALILTMRPAAEHGAEGHAEPAADVDHEGKPHQEGAEPGKGPHGGKLFSEGSYSLEVTIFEQNVAPHFRLYGYRDGKLLAPAAHSVSAMVERLGAPAQAIAFTPEADYLKGNATLHEPHSFKVALQVQVGAARHRFAYEQIEGRVTMSELQASQNGIDFHTSGPARIQSVLKLSGDIALNADRSVQLAPRMAGVVESVHANAGDSVRKGQLLAVLASQQLATERGELRVAQQKLALARTVLQREEMLWKEKISAEQDYQQARAAMNEAQIAVQAGQDKLAALGVLATTGPMARLEIRAPIAGVITDKQLTVGASVAADSTVFVVSDLSSVWVNVSVGERDLDVLKSGQVATVSAGSGEQRATGTVSYISAVVGSQTRAATARVVLPNPDRTWHPGAPVKVDIVAAEVTVPVAVLADAIQSVRDAPAVFGRYGDQFEARPITPGRSDGNYVEVLDGLGAGVRYAARNSFLIKADLGKSGASHDH